MDKIIIIGTTGSGKSTFSLKLSKHLGIPHIQLDKLFWKSNWEWSSNEEFYKAIRNQIDQDSWIVDGNYTRSQAITWTDADNVIWLDLPFSLTFYQCFMRSLRRAISRQEIWEGTGNRESLRRMFSKDSILLWLLKTYKPNKVKYEKTITDTLHSNITFHRLKSRKEMDQFIKRCIPRESNYRN